MYIRNASTINEIRNLLLYSCLASLVLLLITVRHSMAQEKLNLVEPLKRCRVYAGNNGLARIVASDNESNLIITTDNLSVISLNPDSTDENWKSLSGGRLESEAIDDENLFYITFFENENRQKIFTLHSVSLKTGITNWQLKLNEHSEARINQIKSNDMLYLTIDGNSVSAIEKKQGKMSWTKQYSAQIVSVSQSKSRAEELYIISVDSLKRVSGKNGEVINDLKFKKSEISSALVGVDYVLSGYPTGDIIKNSLADSENETLWKVKAGAGISGILEYQDEALITSLDNFIYLYSIERGKLKWKRRVAGRINIKPQVYGHLALIANSGDNSISILDLRDGKIINQVQLEAETYFTGQPVVSNKFLILQTSRGIYFFSGTNSVCK